MKTTKIQGDDQYQVALRLPEYNDTYWAIHVRSDDAWDGWKPVARAYEDEKSLKIVRDLVASANCCNKVIQVADDMATALRSLMKSPESVAELADKFNKAHEILIRHLQLKETKDQSTLLVNQNA